MASVSSVICEKQLECPICFELFKNPVSLPCGHFFCDACIEQHCKDKEQPLCPLCKREISKSLKLGVNTLFRDIVENYKHHVLGDSEKPISQEDVRCDYCPHIQRRAAKTCLVCLTSYCETHLEPHLRVAALKKHKLSDPVPKLEEKTCDRHNRLLEENSSRDQNPVCALCAYETQVQSDKMYNGTKTQPENQYKDAQYIKIKNPRRKNKTKSNRVSMNKADRELTEDYEETEDLDKVQILHKNHLYTFSRLRPECGFSSGRVYYDVPITLNSEWELGVVNEKMRGKRVFSTKKSGRWVVKYCNPKLCVVGCPMSKILCPERVYVCVDYEQGIMFLVHPYERTVLFFLTNCRFKGRLFLFTNNYTREPFVNSMLRGSTSAQSTWFDVFLFIAYIFVSLLFFNQRPNASFNHKSNGQLVYTEL